MTSAAGGSTSASSRMHGGAGEDGRIQTQLQLLGLPYTGSGPEASRLAMGKTAFKERLLDAGHPTPPYVLLEAGDERRTQAARCQQTGLSVGREARQPGLESRREPGCAIRQNSTPHWLPPRSSTNS